MAKFMVDNCCFCVDLRVGCFTIGYLNLIGSCIAIIASAILVAGGIVLASSSDPNHRTIGAVILTVGVINLLIVAVLFAFAVVLLVGLHHRKPGHVKAYIIYSAFFLVISLILLIENLAMGPYDGLSLASRIISILLCVYFVIVIRSYYYQLLEESSGSP